MSVKIGRREYTDAEFGELVELGAGVCGLLRARVARPVDLLVALALAAVACERVLYHRAAHSQRSSRMRPACPFSPIPRPSCHARLHRSTRASRQPPDPRVIPAEITPGV